MDTLDKKQKDFYFSLLRKEDVRQWWCPELEVIFILKGCGRIYFADVKTEYKVCETDIFVINSFEIQDFELEENALALSLKVSIEFLASINPELLKYAVNCRSFLHEADKQETFDILRGDLAKAFEEQCGDVGITPAHFKSKAAAVLEDLSRYFLNKDRPIESKRGVESLRGAVNYIQAHYRENITLDNLAVETFMSKSYISHSFTKYFGSPFTDYVTRLRIGYAEKRMHGKDTLADIAYESGFPNVNAMIQAFKRYRGITPGEYRKKIAGNESGIRMMENGVLEEVRDEFSSLRQYLKNQTESDPVAEKMISITVDMNGRKQRVPLHWKRMINAGYARSLTDRMIQREILYLQNKIGFEYIRIKGILDDDMCFLRSDMHGHTIINYAYVDEVMDFILSAGAKPVIELGHMPRILAREARMGSMRTGLFSLPKSTEQWKTLIAALIGHFAERYGEETVRKWLFAPWLSPDFMDFGLYCREEYEEVYAASYAAIKEVNPNFLIVGPGSTDTQRYLKWFLSMCRRKKCLPDVITFRSFASVIPEEKDGLNLIGNNESFSMAVSADEDIIYHLTEEIRSMLVEEGLSEIPLMLEEWSNNIWQRDLCNDTCYKSAYLFKNILENNHHLNAIGYFTLNDRIDEVPPARDTFHGGFGLFTKNDIPKSVCRALELLGQMGDCLLQRGKGYYISRSGDEIQIYLYNYCHYNLLYRYRHAINMSRTERYQVFVSGETQAFYIRFRNMKKGNYEIRRYGITREGGSSYDAWVKMGAPDPLDREEMELLENLSHPIYRRESVEVGDDAVLDIKASLNPLDIWLIKIKI